MFISHSTSIWLACLGSIVGVPSGTREDPLSEAVRASLQAAAPAEAWAPAAGIGTEPGAAYCAGDGLDAQVTALCDGANVGHPGHGCNNLDPTLGGALLTASGTTNPNTVELRCDGLPSGSSVVFVRSTASAPSGYKVGIGVSCLAGTFVRFGFQASGTIAPFASAAYPATMSPGSTRYYQVIYRITTTGDLNASNGYAITW